MNELKFDYDPYCGTHFIIFGEQAFLFNRSHNELDGWTYSPDFMNGNDGEEYGSWEDFTYEQVKADFTNVIAQLKKFVPSELMQTAVDYLEANIKG